MNETRYRAIKPIEIGIIYLLYHGSASYNFMTSLTLNKGCIINIINSHKL